MKEFIDLLLGNMPFYEWVYCWLLMAMGALLYILLRVKRRDNKTTKASVKVWIQDDKYKNIKAGIVAVILTYILIRFYANYQDAIIKFLPEGMKVTRYFLMVVVGFGQHRIAEWLTKLANKNGKTE